MKVPFIDIKPQAALVRAPVLERWAQTAESAAFLGGPAIDQLEHALASCLGVEHVVTCGSGSAALLLGLQALGVGAGAKVALPNLTFWATYEAVVRLGATPVLIDVDQDDLQMDLDELDLATRRIGIDAVILVHLMGWATPRLEEFRRFCANRGIALLEDGAQSFGVEVDGQPVYRGAQVSTLSFFPAKVIGGCMDGGAVATDDPERAELLRKLRNHGRSSHYGYDHIGWNSRMSVLQASWLLEMLEHREMIVAQRRFMHDRTLELLERHGQRVRRHGPPRGVRGNGYLSVCELTRHSPEAVANKMAEYGVSTGKVYPSTMDAQAPAAGALRVSDLSRGREFCQRVINLPLYYGMTDQEHAWAHEAFSAALAADG